MVTVTKIKNLARLNRKFKALPKRAEDAIRAEIAKGAQQIVDMMVRLVPVATRGTSHKKGALKASIGWTWGEPPEGAHVFGSLRGGKSLTATIYAGSAEAYWARWVEFGTVKTPAQPFFFPSYRANSRKIKAAIKRAVSKSAKAEAV